MKLGEMQVCVAYRGYKLHWTSDHLTMTSAEHIRVFFSCYREGSGSKLDISLYPIFQMIYEYLDSITLLTIPIIIDIEHNTKKFILENDINQLRDMTEGELTLFKLVVLK